MQELWACRGLRYRPVSGSAANANGVERVLTGLRAGGGRTIVPFIVGEHPRRGDTGPLLAALDGAGAGVIEVGIPYSDPIADGPVITAAMHRALRTGITPPDVFEAVAGVRGQIRAAVVAMCTISIVWRMGGPATFCRQAAAAGFDGIIVPDVPIEEGADVAAAARDLGLACPFLVAPTTPAPRACRIARACTGFVYVLARTGTTGERSDMPRVAATVACVRSATDLPVACGFGISTPAHVREVARHADAAIVGSALVRALEHAAERGQDVPAAGAALLTTLATGLTS